MVSKKRKAAAAAGWQQHKRKNAHDAEEKVNPFEIRYTKRKHDVMGQVVKGQIGRRGRARDVAIDTRKKTLLVEMKNKHKTGAFVDKRFGEYDTSMSAEERMLQRFQFERVKHHQRASQFNLPDDDAAGALGDDDDDGSLLGSGGRYSVFCIQMCNSLESS